MEQILQIGDKLVVVDDEVKDISEVSKKITEIAEKYKADVLAIISKSDNRNIVVHHKEKQIANLIDGIAKIMSIIEVMAKEYDVEIKDIVDVINFVMEERE